jgi:hypothetical protein
MTENGRVEIRMALQVFMQIEYIHVQSKCYFDSEDKLCVCVLLDIDINN